jgi:hypothetical protein
MIIAFTAIIFLIVVVYLLYCLIKSCKMLRHWADIFSIRVGMTIAMSNTSKDLVESTMGYGARGNPSKDN